MMKSLLGILLLLLAVVCGIFWYKTYGPDTRPPLPDASGQYQFRTISDFEIFEKVLVSVGDAEIIAELAVTGAQRQKGLSGREPLGEQEGLFFVFSHDSTHGFWMKDMKFAIDMIWLDHDFRVVGFKENALPESFPEVFEPQYGDARYVLEVNSGFITKYNIAPNTQFEIEGID